jgi:hypothetical protein
MGRRGGSGPWDEALSIWGSSGLRVGRALDRLLHVWWGTRSTAAAKPRAPNGLPPVVKSRICVASLRCSSVKYVEYSPSSCLGPLATAQFHSVRQTVRCSSAPSAAIRPLPRKVRVAGVASSTLSGEGRSCTACNRDLGGAGSSCNPCNRYPDRRGKVLHGLQPGPWRRGKLLQPLHRYLGHDQAVDNLGRLPRPARTDLPTVGPGPRLKWRRGRRRYAAVVRTGWLGVRRAPSPTRVLGYYPFRLEDMDMSHNLGPTGPSGGPGTATGPTGASGPFVSNQLESGSAPSAVAAGELRPATASDRASDIIRDARVVFDRYLAATPDPPFARSFARPEGDYLYPEATLQADMGAFSGVFTCLWRAFDGDGKTHPIFTEFYNRKPHAFRELAGIVDPQPWNPRAGFWEWDDTASTFVLRAVADVDGIWQLCRTLRHGFAHFNVRWTNVKPTEYFARLGVPLPPAKVFEVDEAENYRVFICNWLPKHEFMALRAESRIIATHFAHLRYQLFMFLARIFPEDGEAPYEDIIYRRTIK